MNKLYIFIGCRYAKIAGKGSFISFISLTSTIGIGLGVAVLITVLSVMNGFRKEIRNHLLSISPHITSRVINEANNWQQDLQKIKNQSQVIGVAPFISGNSLLAANDQTAPALLYGISLRHSQEVYPIAKYIIAGNLEKINKIPFSIAIGKNLAAQLGVQLDDKVAIFIPETTVTPAGLIPRMKQARIVAIYHSSSHLDNNYIFMDLVSGAKLYRKNNISGFEIRIKDELQSKSVVKKLYSILGDSYFFSDWTDQYQSFLQAINMEKTVMTCILFLIIMVATFNLVSTLVMVVTEKRKDIAILLAMGATPGTIMKIFVWQGSFLGLIGVFFGSIFGLLLAHNVTVVVNWLQKLFNVQFITEDVYIIGYVPSLVNYYDVLAIIIAAIFLSFIATIYPAWRATKIQPAEALRYE